MLARMQRNWITGGSHCCQEHKMVQPLKNSGKKNPTKKKTIMKLLYNLAISLLGIYSREVNTYIHTKTSNMNIYSSVHFNSQKLGTNFL